MDREILRRLEKLNQLQLTEQEKEAFLAFYAKQESEMDVVNAINTDDIERMVHVMPILTVVREDKVIKKYTREELQKGAPETTEGYWQVPRLVE